MIPYVLIAMLASGLCLLSSYFESKSRVLQMLFLCLSAFVFCFFAGLRGVDVGSDTAGYGLSSYLTAVNTDFLGFYFNSIYASWAPLYKCLCWVSSNLGGSFFSYLFCIQMMTVIPLYIATHRTLGKYLAFAVLIYGLVFYPMSFNMMRQMIAMSFLLLAYIYADDRKPAWFLVFVLIAWGFHGSALIALCIYPLVLFATNDLNRLSYGIRIAMFAALSAALMAMSSTILDFMASVGFYSAYVDGSGVVAGGGLRTIVVTWTIGILLAVLGWLFTKKTGVQTRLSLVGLFLVVAFGVICLQLSLISLWLYRIGFYFIYFAVLALPTCALAIPDKHSRIFFMAVVPVVLCIWSYDYYVVQLSHSVIPYCLSILQI